MMCVFSLIRSVAVLAICLSGGGTIHAGTPAPVCDTVKVYRLVEVDEIPRFGDGGSSVIVYILQRFSYREKEGETQTKFRLGFVINELGEVVRPHIYGKTEDEYTEAEKRLVGILADMPLWVPGRLGGETVPVIMLLPVHIDIREYR